MPLVQATRSTASHTTTIFRRTRLHHTPRSSAQLRSPNCELCGLDREQLRNLNLRCHIMKLSFRLSVPDLHLSVRPYWSWHYQDIAATGVKAKRLRHRPTNDSPHHSPDLKNLSEAGGACFAPQGCRAFTTGASSRTAFCKQPRRAGGTRPFPVRPCSGLRRFRTFAHRIAAPDSETPGISLPNSRCCFTRNAHPSRRRSFSVPRTARTMAWISCSALRLTISEHGACLRRRIAASETGCGSASGSRRSSGPPPPSLRTVPWMRELSSPAFPTRKTCPAGSSTVAIPQSPDGLLAPSFELAAQKRLPSFSLG